MQGELGRLENEILEYHGYLNEKKAGLIQNIPVQEPVEMIRYKQVRAMGIPLVEGGVMDQPHIWLLQYAVCKNMEDLFAALEKSNAIKENQGRPE